MNVNESNASENNTRSKRSETIGTFYEDPSENKLSEEETRNAYSLISSNPSVQYQSVTLQNKEASQVPYQIQKSLSSAHDQYGVTSSSSYVDDSATGYGIETDVTSRGNQPSTSTISSTPSEEEDSTNTDWNSKYQSLVDLPDSRYKYEAIRDL